MAEEAVDLHQLEQLLREDQQRYGTADARALEDRDPSRPAREDHEEHESVVAQPGDMRRLDQLDDDHFEQEDPPDQPVHGEEDVLHRRVGPDQRNQHRGDRQQRRNRRRQHEPVLHALGELVATLSLGGIHTRHCR